MVNEKRRHSALIRAYFKNGCLGKKDFLLAAVNKKIPYAINAKKTASFLKENDANREKEVSKVTIDIQPYSGSNPFAKRMIDFLAKNLKEDIIGAYAHGSVGNGEDIKYSDFDGFVILKNKPLQNPFELKRIAFLLNQSEKIMTEMDPLQHHGWFILTEDDLNNYPEDYLPHELWQYATALLGATQLEIHVNTKGYHDEFIGAYHKFSSHLLRNLRSKNFLSDNYELKSVLSGFMLLPSIYLQAKTGKAIFKKFSFDELKKSFGDNYSIMEEVSAIRFAWNYQPSFLYRWLLDKKPFLLSYFFKKKMSGQISAELKNKINTAFIQRMIDFVELLNKDLVK